MKPITIYFFEIQIPNRPPPPCTSSTSGTAKKCWKRFQPRNSAGKYILREIFFVWENCFIFCRVEKIWHKFWRLQERKAAAANQTLVKTEGPNGYIFKIAKKYCLAKKRNLFFIISEMLDGDLTINDSGVGENMEEEVCFCLNNTRFRL